MMVVQYWVLQDEQHLEWTEWGGGVVGQIELAVVANLRQKFC